MIPHEVTKTREELTEEIRELRARIDDAVRDIQAIQNDNLPMRGVWGHAMSAEYHLTLGLDARKEESLRPCDNYQCRRISQICTFRWTEIVRLRELLNGIAGAEGPK